MHKLQSLEIPKYIVKVKTADSRQKKYYSKESQSYSHTYTEEGLGSEKYDPIRKNYSGPPYELPCAKTKLIKVYTGDAYWKKKGSYTYLYDSKTDKRFVANKQSAGTPNYQVIGGNHMISSRSEWPKKYIKDGLKEFYKPYVTSMTPFNSSDYPLHIHWHLYTQPDRNANDFDLDNLWVYSKYFFDSLTDHNIIEDDGITYITNLYGPTLHPVDEWNDRKFVFDFYSDNRNVLNHEFWK